MSLQIGLQKPWFPPLPPGLSAIISCFSLILLTSLHACWLPGCRSNIQNTLLPPSTTELLFPSPGPLSPQISVCLASLLPLDLDPNIFFLISWSPYVKQFTFSIFPIPSSLLNSSHWLLLSISSITSGIFFFVCVFKMILAHVSHHKYLLDKADCPVVLPGSIIFLKYFSYSCSKQHVGTVLKPKEAFKECRTEPVSGTCKQRVGLRENFNSQCCCSRDGS